MSIKKLDDTTLDNLLFFGSISASFSHEINNVVSIVKELSGLMGDYMLAAESGRPLDVPKLKDKIEKITGAAGRGEGIIKNFNRFAHSADKPAQVIQLDDILVNFVAVTQRIAGLKGVTLSVSESSDKEISIETNPFVVMNILFTVLKDIIDNADGETNVELTASSGSNGVQAIVSSDANPSGMQGDRRTEVLDAILDTIGAKLEVVSPQDGVYQVMLSLPE